MPQALQAPQLLAVVSPVRHMRIDHLAYASSGKQTSLFGPLRAQDLIPKAATAPNQAPSGMANPCFGRFKIA